MRTSLWPVVALLISIVPLFLLATPQAIADVVTLKDGRRLPGKVVAEEKARIHLEHAEGGDEWISRSQVLQVEIDSPPKLTACGICSGQQVVTCPYCPLCSGCEAGRKPCSACKGMGKSGCTGCSGSGWDLLSRERACSACAGTGGKPCSSCKGAATVPCTKCKGKGTAVGQRCWLCEGKGKWDCRFCSDGYEVDPATARHVMRQALFDIKTKSRWKRIKEEFRLALVTFTVESVETSGRPEECTVTGTVDGVRLSCCLVPGQKAAMGDVCTVLGKFSDPTETTALRMWPTVLRRDERTPQKD